MVDTIFSLTSGRSCYSSGAHAQQRAEPLNPLTLTYTAIQL